VSGTSRQTWAKSRCEAAFAPALPSVGVRRCAAWSACFPLVCRPQVNLSKLARRRPSAHQPPRAPLKTNTTKGRQHDRHRHHQARRRPGRRAPEYVLPITLTQLVTGSGIETDSTPEATREEMSAAKLPLPYRDSCAHLLIPLNRCRYEEYYLPWKCEVCRHPR
jgi:hypothetical protein